MPSSRLRIAIATLFLLIVGSHAYVGQLHTSLAWTMAIITSCSVLLYLQQRHKAVTYLLLFCIILFFALETSLWGAYKTQLLPPHHPELIAFNHPCARYDSIRGYRWYGQSNRAALISHGTPIYDNIFTPNAQGYISKRNYERSKNGKKRLLVFGDSFTDSYFLSTTWVDQLQKTLDAQHVPLELYSFAVDGGGIANWSSIYWKEIVPHYEFDGVLFAIAENDLVRDFFVFHHLETQGVSAYVNTPIPSTAVFHDSLLPELKEPNCAIMEDARIDEQLQNASEAQLPASFGFLTLATIRARLADLTTQENWTNYVQRTFERNNEPYQNASRYKENNSPESFALMDSLCIHLKRNHKEVLFVSVPSILSLPVVEKYGSTRLQKDVAFLSTYYRATGWDGFEVFDQMESEKWQDYFLEYDFHWNQQGSDLFADFMYEQLLRWEPLHQADSIPQHRN